METRTELKIARIRAGYTQRSLSEQLSVSQQTVAKWEIGTTTPSHFSHLRALEELLATPACRMFPDIFEPINSVAQ